MNKFFSFTLSIFGLSLLFAKQALAVCPICTIAVGAGVGFSRWIGIDDSVTGLWIGGLIVSIIIWTLNWFDKKNIKFKARSFITAAAYYILTFVPLYFSGLIGNYSNAIYFGLDKLTLSIIVGSFAFWFGAEWYLYLKEKNSGHAYFPFQKVLMPISPLVVVSFIFYLLTS